MSLSPTHSRPQMIRKLRGRFERLYGADNIARCMSELEALLARHPSTAAPPEGLWSERDVVLITYADMVRRPKEPGLAGLKRFLDKRLARTIPLVHILPFFPYSSDDGFSIIDYRQVNTDFGEWSHVKALGEHFGLMFDLVLNHCSQHSEWFRNYLAGSGPGHEFFIEVDPETDLCAVVRPRSLPLLTPFETSRGLRHVWTTFSDDQVDVDFSNPAVLFEFLDILLFYVDMGARVLRLDAIAYLWKRIGTACIHLPETHEVVKVFRNVLEIAAPDVLLLTETNVPHEENVSYFGDGDEAHVVYNFSLPPLLLHALASGNAEYLTGWAQGLSEAPPGCAFLNFTASHDGIGVRPLEGLLPETERTWLFERVRQLGGDISTKRNADGTDSPYELNITYFDALGDTPEKVTQTHVDRFLCSQTIALGLRGIPAIYFHSLTATRNWCEGVAETGRARTINRRKWDETELDALLDAPQTPTHTVFHELVRRIRVRIGRSAFSPDAGQHVCELGSEVFAFLRTAADNSETVLCCSNVTDRRIRVNLGSTDISPCELRTWRDLLGSDIAIGDTANVELAPYQTAWLARSAPDQAGESGY